ncbi:2-oxo acid dehydrogenase subunit E2 [Nitratiruptor sp. SB155-2]|uniref:2-oxo acid dehydrogenase subunit E2 n=1 Tax=Nitratiruptor sp. (strain SB155-2) TaxID=387092 RepID=UPI000158717A|nr:2-oxo acid dehydrogenase subunit E2 [Nitratiruptor sp. SB155-2]BAF70043.1 pyruvate/2-oxoglutarate dehydrogenase complex, E2 component, dihydrolipoamide acetyltransferase [Nitratiruptor sp. SB155-2]
MDYKIVMPVLSDTMDKGKLIKWHVKEGDVVHKGDVIAEVESDKAIMEVQTFKDGVVKKLLVKEGDEVPVKEPIAILDTEVKEPVTKTQASEQKEQPKEKTVVQKEESKPQTPQKSEVPPVLQELMPTSTSPSVEGYASPAAKKAAAKANIDIESLQKEGILPKPAHLKDINEELLKRYFTPKALHLLQEYQIDAKKFSMDHKINEKEVQDFILKNNIPKPVPLSSNQKAVKQNVEGSTKKPTYLIMETFDIKPYEDVKLTSVFIKTIADVMQRHPLTRAVLDGERYLVYPTSNISVAVAKGNDLFMVVCKNAEQKSLEEIDEWVRGLKKRNYSAEELSGSTFGISNLGMFGIDRFSAMINKKDSGIAAFGALNNGKIKVTFTFDHRVLNGVDAAKFVSDLKNSFKGNG